MAILHVTLEPARRRARALEASLRAAIRGGRLAAGTRLPSSRALAQDLGLARSTVSDAYAQLEAEGFLVARRGAGTWVADLAPTPAGAHGPALRSPPARLSFNPGVPDLTAFPHAAWTRALGEGLRDLPSRALGYGDARGLAELRSALAEYLARARGVVADPELTVVCAGFSHALSLSARVMRQSGVCTMAMEDPCLWSHRDIVRATGLEVVPLPVDEHGARTALLPESTAGAVMLAAAHQFPLGSVLSPERRAAAVSWARATGGMVIEDDYDAELRYDRPPIGALQALAPDRVVFAGTVSKTLAPGLRLGWMVVPETLLDRIVRLRRVEDFHVATTEQIAFARFLASGAFERHVRRMRHRYRRRRERVLAMLARRAPQARPSGVSAGLRILLELPGDGPDAETLAERGAERSLELFPVGRCYHAGRSPPGRDGLVLGYAALADHDFDRALELLGDLLERELAPAPGRGRRGE